MKKFMITYLKTYLGIDRAIFITLLVRFWNVISGFVTIFIITLYVSPELQGYYYAFNSIIALQVFAEMGLNFAIVQFASHNFAKLSWLSDGTISGDQEAKRKLQSLLHFSILWIGFFGLLMIVILSPAGLLFLNSDNSNIETILTVSIPWISLVIFTAVNLFINAGAAILEGCGKVSQVAEMRLLQSLSSAVIAWIILIINGRLYVFFASSLMIVFVGSTWIWMKYRSFFRDLITYQSLLPKMNWRKEIWPFQWRIAVSWISGYLSFQLFSLILFKTHGPVVSGQMGMSMQIISAINGTAMAWISTKAPLYGKLITFHQRHELDLLFSRFFWQSLWFLLVSIVSILFIAAFLSEIDSPYVLRIIPLPLFFFLCFACILNHVVYVEAAYLRAHKEDPFMWLSVLSGGLTSVLALLFIPPFGVFGAVYSYVAITLFIGFCGGTFIFLRKHKKWTQSP